MDLAEIGVLPIRARNFDAAAIPQPGFQITHINRLTGKRAACLSAARLQPKTLRERPARKRCPWIINLTVDTDRLIMIGKA
jgi:hypothetical protein